MLDLLRGLDRNCDGISRRSLLKRGSVGSLVSLPFWLQQRGASAKEGKPRAADVSCIYIWTHGGTSHHDTLDPKPTAPPAVKGPFGVIDTAVPGVQFSEICPRLARELGRFALLRLEPHERQPRHRRHLVHVGTEVQPRPDVSLLRFGNQPAARLRVGSAAVRPVGKQSRPLLAASPEFSVSSMPFEIDSDPAVRDFAVPILRPQGNRIARRGVRASGLDRLAAAAGRPAAHGVDALTKTDAPRSTC